MAEYIDRETALAVFHDWVDKHGDVHTVDEIPEYEAIENLPAADVRPVVRGKWSTVYDDFMKSNYDTCSCCGKEYFGAKGFNFCPNCGADMKEGN